MSSKATGFSHSENGIALPVSESGTVFRIGSALCVLGMVTLKHFISDRHIWICSIIGAVLHNIGQLAVTMIVMGTFAVFGYLPFLLIGGCIAGAFTGICAQLIISKFPSDNTKL